jgi:hypothetical protein
MPAYAYVGTLFLNCDIITTEETGPFVEKNGKKEKKERNNIHCLPVCLGLIA